MPRSNNGNNTRRSGVGEVPSLDGNPAERRRLLNVLCQRRYRQRQREKLRQLATIQVQGAPAPAPAPSKDDGNNLAPSQQLFDQPGLCNDSQEPSVTQPFSFDLNLTPQTGSLFSDSDFITSALRPLVAGDFGSFESNYLDSTPTTKEDVASFDPSEALEDSIEHSNLFEPSIFSIRDEGDAGLLLAPGPDETLETGTSGPGQLVSDQYISSPALDFADYAITTPGLSIIRAHTEIFRHMHGSAFQLDIWNPAAISPVCLGHSPASVPPHFRPTPLQRSVSHHPIIDFLPWPSFRDKFLYVMSLPTHLRPKIAQGDMPSATVELMSAAKDAAGGLRVWGLDPYCIDNWEIGQVFYSRFWWAIDAEIVRSSNRIRAQRGEDALRFRVTEVE